MGRVTLLLLLCATLLSGREWKLRIGGMHCVACTLAVKKALLSVPGVQEARVNYKYETATVTTDETVTLRLMQQAIAQTGYSAVPFP